MTQYMPSAECHGGPPAPAPPHTNSGDAPMIGRGPLVGQPAPTTVAVEILYGCNLRCVYCYVGTERNHVKPVVPPLSTTLRVLEELRSAGVRQVYLIGGEPTLHPHFLQICEAVAKLEFAGRGLVTNGTRVDDPTASVLKENEFWVDVSFRAADPGRFNTIAGADDAFRAATTASETLTRHQIPFGIEFDCLPSNYQDLLGIIRLLAGRGIRPRHVLVHRIAPTGDAAPRPDLQLTVDQYRAVFEQAAAIEDEYAIPTFFEDGFPLCLIDPRFWRHVRPCECGEDLLTVDPEGNVRRCACTIVHLGSILTTGLSPIWLDQLADYRSSSWYPDACKQCLLFERCRGGCSASGPSDSGYAADRLSDSFRPFRSLSSNMKALASRMPDLYPLD